MAAHFFRKNGARISICLAKLLPKCKNTPGIYRELAMTMDDEKKFEIDRILRSVHSIHDLDRRARDELAGTLAGRFVVEKMKVKPSRWRAWKDGHGGMQGVEYDAAKRRLIIKAVPSILHETVNAVMTGWSYMVAKKLRKATGTKFWNSENLGELTQGLVAS